MKVVRRDAKFILLALVVLFLFLLTLYWQYVLAAASVALALLSEAADEIRQNQLLFAMVIIIYLLNRIRKAVESLKEPK